MGGGSYSISNRTERAFASGYFHKSANEIFSDSLHKEMQSVGVEIRESCDSEEHPESKAIIIALDVTGSMGIVPHELIKNGLPNIMKTLLEKGVKDPQIMFMAIGDHKCDRAPLQLGQFESSDELMDKWLEKIWLEGGGGGNGGESYHLAWYFAANHTSIDCFNNRHEKGLLITIGDDKTHRQIKGEALKEVMGNGEFEKELSAVKLLDDARNKYDVFHINFLDWRGSQEETKNDWKELIGDHLFNASDVLGIIDLIGQICMDKYVSKIKKQTTTPKNNETEIIL